MSIAVKTVFMAIFKKNNQLLTLVDADSGKTHQISADHILHDPLCSQGDDRQHFFTWCNKPVLHQI